MYFCPGSPQKSVLSSASLSSHQFPFHTSEFNGQTWLHIVLIFRTFTHCFLEVSLVVFVFYTKTLEGTYKIMDLGQQDSFGRQRPLGAIKPGSTWWKEVEEPASSPLTHTVRQVHPRTHTEVNSHTRNKLKVWCLHFTCAFNFLEKKMSSFVPCSETALCTGEMVTQLGVWSNEVIYAKRTSNTEVIILF